MKSLRFASAEALASHPQVALQSLDSVAHNLYPLLFKASYLLERAEVIRALLQRWPLEEFRLGALLGPSPDHAGDLRDRACRACLEACLRGLADHVLQGRGQRRLQLADLTGVRDVQVQQCPCGRALGRWGRTELLARTCCELQADPHAAQHSVKVLADIFVTDGNFQLVVQALGPAAPAPLRLRCLSFRADSLDPSQLLQVLCLAGPGELRRLQVVHNVRLHAGHVQQLLAQLHFPQLVSLTLPAKAFDTPPACAPTTEGEDPLLTSIAWELSQMTQLTELSVAFSTLTGNIQKLLGPLRTPLRALDLANCSLNHADMAFLAGCTHAAHLEVLDLSGHSLVHLFPSSFFRLLGRAAQTLRVLTLEECGIEDRHLSTLILALSPCQQLQELRFLGNPLSASALRRLFLALCELPKLRWVEFPVPKDCYPEGAAYPQDELAMSKFDQQKYELIAEDLRGVLLRAGRDDIQVSTPVFGSFDPDIQETSNELGVFLLQAFKTALENFSRALKQME
ncbi:leucine-rich repeat-containing protein 14B [Myotis lucifugus]|uniref:Leucine-rich repeat-containing protein 14B n=1 Tax=Myotis lucifugus TaxID=59463 RepID=G1PVV5_MYOLU|nr:leucine-rich repeat-containing protein 14B [Myotis lucifugus]XP_023607850.1 leucine-rich repeat-containing protein 14B [Myotis lucifugus]